MRGGLFGVRQIHKGQQRRRDKGLEAEGVQSLIAILRGLFLALDLSGDEESVVAGGWRYRLAEDEKGFAGREKGPGGEREVGSESDVGLQGWRGDPVGDRFGEERIEHEIDRVAVDAGHGPGE